MVETTPSLTLITFTATRTTSAVISVSGGGGGARACPQLAWGKRIRISCFHLSFIITVVARVRVVNGSHLSDQGVLP